MQGLPVLFEAGDVLIDEYALFERFLVSQAFFVARTSVRIRDELVELMA